MLLVNSSVVVSVGRHFSSVMGGCPQTASHSLLSINHETHVKTQPPLDSSLHPLLDVYIVDLIETILIFYFVMEFFSVPRVTKVAAIAGFRAGVSFDLSSGWDASIKVCRVCMG